MRSPLFIQETNSNSRYCAESLNTVRYVASCPSTEQETRFAAEKKNCKAIAHNQNCTDPAKFQYHCLINELDTSLLEVCAPEFYILGMLSVYLYLSMTMITLVNILFACLLIAYCIKYCNFQAIVQSSMFKEEGYKTITRKIVAMSHLSVLADISQQKHIFVCLHK